MAAAFYVEVMVRGYHIYKDIWTAVMGEEFQCQWESGNRFDLYAIASSHTLAVVKMLKFHTSNFCTEHNFYEIYEILHYENFPIYGIW